MELPSSTESAIRSAQEVGDPDEIERARCPICGSDRTWLYRTDVTDLEYFVLPPREFLMQKCGDCGSEFLTPRPLESELPPFYPSDYHAYNENHSGVARLLVQLRARSRARFYDRLIQSHPGRIFDVGTGDCRHFDELRRFLDLECAGIEIQPDVAEKGRARGYDVLEGALETADLTDHLGKYDIVSMNHILEHVVSPHTMLERAHDLLRPGGHLIGQLPTVS
jgi:SAM-dependent methyltransferase